MAGLVLGFVAVVAVVAVVVAAGVFWFRGRRAAWVALLLAAFVAVVVAASLDGRSGISDAAIGALCGLPVLIAVVHRRQRSVHTRALVSQDGRSGAGSSG